MWGDASDALASAMSRCPLNRASTLTTLNAELTRMFVAGHPDLTRFVDRSVAVTADGWPIITLFRRVFHVPVRRLTGRQLLAAACLPGGPDALLLGGPDHEYAPHVHHVGGEIVAGDARLCAQVLGWLKARPSVDKTIVFLALGSDKTAAVFDRLAPALSNGDLPATLWVTVGSSAATIAQPDIYLIPARWEQLGLGWAWRLIREPKRLARRYLLDAMFIASVALAVLSGRARPR